MLFWLNFDLYNIDELYWSLQCGWDLQGQLEVTERRKIIIVWLYPLIWLPEMINYGKKIKAKEKLFIYKFLFVVKWKEIKIKRKQTK